MSASSAATNSFSLFVIWFGSLQSFAVRIALVKRAKLVSLSIFRITRASGLNVVGGPFFVRVLATLLLCISTRNDSAIQGRNESVFSRLYCYVCQSPLLRLIALKLIRATNMK